jgi:outer membrane lipoprotein SlyB
VAETDSTETVREAVGIFASAETLQAAIDDLLTSGFDRAELSLLAGEDSVVEKLGHRYTRVTELEDEPEAATVCYVSPESLGGAEGALMGGLLYLGAVAATGAILISGGTLAAAAIGAVAAGGAGGLVGTWLAKLVGDSHAEYLQQQLDHGGLLLWVRTWNAADEASAVRIMSRHSGRDVHVHGLQPLP